MSRIAAPAVDAAPEASRPLLEATRKSLGSVPNLFRVVANSPVALEAYLAFNGALSKALDAKTRERIAIAIAETNGCDYCLSAHTYLGINLAKITAEDAALARKGSSSDPKAAAAVAFARKVAVARGQVADADIAEVKAAGYSDAQIVEIVSHVALNTLTNFINNVAETEVDFPVVRVGEAA
ncbi:MAG: peroxidase-related enzyme [Pseudomonadota bacterium]|nr:peroxidase-related enzyme [Pseudomonadota bacterium]